MEVTESRRIREDIQYRDFADRRTGRIICCDALKMMRHILQQSDAQDLAVQKKRSSSFVQTGIVLYRHDEHIHHSLHIVNSLQQLLHHA